MIPKVFVLHVRKGYEERERHINSMMHKAGIDFEYVLACDIPDLTPEIIEKTIAPEGMLAGKPAAISCLMKHLHAYSLILERDLPGAIILEDDILLYPNFEDIAMRALGELGDTDTASLISFEDTRLRFVKGSVRQKGKVLYPGICDRFAGAYYINRAGAEAVLQNVKQNRAELPIDLLHNHMLDTGELKYYWTHPCTASQGSFNGLFTSSLSASDRSKAFIWRLQRMYKKLLYRLR